MKRLRRFYSLAQRLRGMATLDDTLKPFADFFEAVRESPGILWDQGTVRMAAAAARRKRR